MRGGGAAVEYRIGGMTGKKRALHQSRYRDSKIQESIIIKTTYFRKENQRIESQMFVHKSLVR